MILSSGELVIAADILNVHVHVSLTVLAKDMSRWHVCKLIECESGYSVSSSVMRQSGWMCYAFLESSQIRIAAVYIYSQGANMRL